MEEGNYNISNLIDFAAGDENFIREMLEFFVTDSPEVLINLKNATENSDYEIIRQVSHKFSSQLSLVEIDEVNVLMSEIEHLALEKAEIDKIKDRVDQAVILCLESIAKIKTDFDL